MRINEYGSAWERLAEPPAQLPAAVGGGAAAVGVTRSTRVDVTLTTKDGDIVTLSSSRAATAIAAAGTDGDAPAAAVLRSTSASFSVAVEGSLDRQELTDIRKALKALAHSARRLDVEQLQRRLSRADLDSLASLSASVERTVRVIGGVLTLPSSSQEPIPPVLADVS